MSMSDWLRRAEVASDAVGTPCYAISESCIREAIGQLSALETSVRLEHWVSLKTQPVARLVRMATRLGLGIDVVSECELAAAVSAGVPAGRILVNGVGKHHWLPKHAIPNLRVHFDSIAEVLAMVHLASAMNWRVGLRCAIPEPAEPAGSRELPDWDQFGMTLPEARQAAAVLAETGVAVSGLHFHLHTKVGRVSEYRRALRVVANVAEATCCEPEYIDVGGGMPIAGELAMDGTCAASTFELGEFREFLASIPLTLPSVREVWLENGRFLTARAGALVVTVLEKKERGDGTYLICDGGRVNHARMASVEKHEILISPARQAPLRRTVVCGPTCSSVDRLGCWMLPDSVAPGDRIIWMTAGAYHIPLETRFSAGLAPVVWFDEKHAPEVIRERETPREWWGRWISRDVGHTVSIG
jgi:diaminopimelate decarboxylase